MEVHIQLTSLAMMMILTQALSSLAMLMIFTQTIISMLHKLLKSQENTLETENAHAPLPNTEGEQDVNETCMDDEEQDVNGTCMDDEHQ